MKMFIAALFILKQKERHVNQEEDQIMMCAYDEVLAVMLSERNRNVRLNIIWFPLT